MQAGSTQDVSYTSKVELYLESLAVLKVLPNMISNMFRKRRNLLEETYMICISSHKPSNITQLKKKKKFLLQSPTELQMKTNFLLCSSAPWLLWRFQVTWIVTVFNQCSEDSGFNASVCGSYHHSTSCFSFLTGFSHFIFSHFWLNSSEWNWAGVAVGLFKVFCINFFYLYSAGFIFISISGYFSPCFSEAIGLIHRILLLRLQGKHIEVTVAQ